MRNSLPAADVFWAACEAGSCRRGSGSCSCCRSGNESQPGQLVRVLVVPRLLREGWALEQGSQSYRRIAAAAAAVGCLHRPSRPDVETFGYGQPGVHCLASS